MAKRYGIEDYGRKVAVVDRKPKYQRDVAECRSVSMARRICALLNADEERRASGGGA